MQAIILAGGKGTRLHAAVPAVPKPIAPVDGRPFLEHQMAHWVAQGVDGFIVSVGYKAAMIIDCIGSRFDDVPVDYAVEDEPRGTGGGLLLAMQRLRSNAPFLVLNGDTFFDVPLSDLRLFHQSKNSDLTLGLFLTGDPKRYLGIDLDHDGRLISLAVPSANQEVWANGGVYMISPGVLSHMAERFKGEISLECEIIPALLAQNAALYGIRHVGRFIDIGIPSDYLRANNVLNPLD
jgi:D-glycero-alpha-D-manno-heptose 1-phosphate guanylyltransferase